MAGAALRIRIGIVQSFLVVQAWHGTHESRRAGGHLVLAGPPSWMGRGVGATACVRAAGNLHDEITTATSYEDNDNGGRPRVG